MKVLVSGSSGFIGRALVEGLLRRGDEVVRLVRRPPTSSDETRWNPIEGRLDPAVLEDADAVVNLSGANIAGRRWSREYKIELRSSRLRATQTLVRAIGEASRPPDVLINASAVGIYGDRGDEILDESAAPGEGFLPELTRSWEEATVPAAENGVRVVLVRLGMVIGNGGALVRMLPAFRLGLGGPIGNGRQWWPWIAIGDAVAAVVFALEHPEISGPVNVVSPEAVTSKDFARTLGRALRRPAFLPAPAWAVRMAAGEMADALLLASARVRPSVLEAGNFRFETPSLDSALSKAIETGSQRD